MTEPEGVGNFCGKATEDEIERATAIAWRVAKPFALSAEEWARVTEGVLRALGVE
jgi:hypothetical protein